MSISPFWIKAEVGEVELSQGGTCCTGFVLLFAPQTRDGRYLDWTAKRKTEKVPWRQRHIQFRIKYFVFKKWGTTAKAVKEMILAAIAQAESAAEH